MDRHFGACDEAGIFFSHQPIYGVGSSHSQPYASSKLARTLQLLRILSRIRFHSFVDVGGGEGYLSHIVRRLFGVQGISADLSVEACRRAFDLFRVEGLAIDASCLPFRDDSIDVVVCSEAIEHVEFPIEVLLELDRVARGILILTSEEIYSDRDRIERFLGDRRDLPHAERNAFHPDDLRIMLGSEIGLRSQFDVVEATPERASKEVAAAWVRRAAKHTDYEPGRRGGVVVKTKDPSLRIPNPRYGDEVLIEFLLEPMVAEGPLVRTERERPGDRLLESIVCCACRGELAMRDDRLTCATCGRGFAVEQGVPVLFLDAGYDPTRERTHDRLRRLWPREPERVRAALEIRDRLLMPARSTQTRWDFSKLENQRGWLVSNELVRVASDEPGLHWQSTGPDPWFVSRALEIPAASVTAVDVRLRWIPLQPHSGVNHGQIFWAGEDDIGFAEDRSAKFQLHGDGLPHVYSIGVRERHYWPGAGSLLWLRLDPTDGPGELVLFEIELRA